MKKMFLRIHLVIFVAFGILCISGFTGSAQITRSGKNFTVTYSQPKGNEMVLQFTPGTFNITPRTEGGITYSDLNFADKGVVTTKNGYAELPIIHASVELAPDKNVSMQVENGTYTDYTLNYPLLPSRGTIYRNQDPSTIPYTVDPASLVDAWYPVDNATTVDPFIIRDVRGTSVYVYPMQYNAVKNVLRVYNTITVKLIENNTPVVNPLTNFSKSVVSEMDNLYQSVFINYNTLKTSWTHEIGETGHILVFCTARDTTVIKPYILWKKQMGYKVTRQIVATATNVKTTIATAYASDPSLFYVLLVGGWADIKSDAASGAPMDPMLGCVVGTDNYPDICIGRFSGTSSALITTQVDKTIAYEKTPTVGGTWYKAALGVASSKGPGDDNELDYEHIANIWTGRLSTFTYTTQYTDYDPGATVAGVSTPVNSGVGIINFSGDGAITGWAQSGFSVSNVNSLTNGDKLPFIFSVSCVIGSFQSPTCFAEAWLQKSGGGAIAMIGSTINQSWNPPMLGQDYMNDLLVGGYTYANNTSHPGAGTNTDHGKTHFSSIVLNGDILMYTEDNSALDIMQTWTTFGDPSLQVRTDTPKNITLSDSIVPTNSFTTNVHVGGVAFQNALVSLWDGVNQPFSGLTDASGNITITHTLAAGTSAKLTITGFNLNTKIKDVVITDVTDVPTQTPVDNTVNVFPNPATGTVTLSVNSPANGKYTLEVINLLGDVVFTDAFEKNSPSFNKTIDLSKVAKGSYLVKYSSEGTVGYKKLILY